MYPAKQRRVFQFFNGREEVYADPLRVWRRLNHVFEGDPNKVLQAARSPIPEVSFEAKERLIEGIRFAFDMPFDPKTGEGATEEDCEAALKAYERFVLKKKEAPATSPTSSPPTESCPADCPTPTTAASTGTYRG